ncbi:putative G-protein coupled receptor 34 [Genypterus blacodes]|uniref:putative G-protein coupled receptor 34 n=1 Tax=Genypterus blacodes TaxID=154954 RepID=UPI003F7666DB
MSVNSASSYSFTLSTFMPTNASVLTSTLNQTECSFDDEALRLPLAVLYSLFFLFGLVGNLFALLVFLFLHTRRNSVRVFLINCAVADLVLLACLPFRVFYHVNGNKWPLGSLACKMVGNLFYMNMYISIMLLGLISLDRYVRLKGRGRSQRGPLRRLWGYRGAWSWVACGALWGLSLLALLPMITTAEDSELGDKCFQFKQRLKATGKAYFNGAVVLLFWFVFTMLVVSYGKIAARLLRVSRDKPDFPNAQRYGRTAKKSFFVLFLFTVCFVPYHAFRPIYILYQLSDSASCSYLQMVDRTNEVMLLFSAFNSCLDPVMYFLLSGSVRKAAVRALGHRLNFLSDGTSLTSSTTEYHRPSLCLMNSNLHQTPMTSLLHTEHQSQTNDP